MKKAPAAHPPAPAPAAPPAADYPGLERLIFFSDAVFAIAVTLLALDLHLNTTAESLSSAELFQALLAIWPRYLGYAISFLVLGSFWMSHHRKFRYIKRYDGGLMQLNLVLLMAVAFMPFPTQIITQYGNQTATILYALSMALAGLLSGSLWWYAARGRRLIDPDLDPRLVRAETWYPLVTPAIFLLSIGLTFIDSTLAQLSWILILPASILTRESRPGR